MFILILSLVEILCGTNGRGLRERNKTRPSVHLWCLSYVFTMVPGAWDVALFICGPSCTVTTLLWPCSALGSGQLNWQETWMPEESEGCGGCPLKSVLLLNFSGPSVPFKRALEWHVVFLWEAADGTSTERGCRRRSPESSQCLGGSGLGGTEIEACRPGRGPQQGRKHILTLSLKGGVYSTRI